jgi:hypothetical protein
MYTIILITSMNCKGKLKTMYKMVHLWTRLWVNNITIHTVLINTCSTQTFHHRNLSNNLAMAIVTKVSSAEEPSIAEQT